MKNRFSLINAYEPRTFMSLINEKKEAKNSASSFFRSTDMIHIILFGSLAQVEKRMEALNLN